jgi:hypothetical protein
MNYSQARAGNCLVTLGSARRRDAILALRDSGKVKPVSVDEIVAWRHESHKC